MSSGIYQQNLHLFNVFVQYGFITTNIPYQSHTCYHLQMLSLASDSVITDINPFIDPSNHPVLIEPVDLHKIKADAGSQFTSKIFKKHVHISEQPSIQLLQNTKKKTALLNALGKQSNKQKINCWFMPDYLPLSSTMPYYMQQQFSTLFQSKNSKKESFPSYT